MNDSIKPGRELDAQQRPICSRCGNAHDRRDCPLSAAAPESVQQGRTLDQVLYGEKGEEW